jgi:hypothetical protein
VLDKGKAKCTSLKLFMAENMMTTIRGAINSATQPRAINEGLVAALGGSGGGGGGGADGAGDGGVKVDGNVVVFPEVRACACSSAHRSDKHTLSYSCATHPLMIRTR